MAVEGCGLSPSFGGAMVLDCEENQSRGPIAYENVGPGNEAAWNADPAINDSGLPYPPALPLYTEFNAPAPYQTHQPQRDTAQANHAPAKESAESEEPAGLVSSVNHAIAPIVGGLSAVAAATLAAGGIPSATAPFLVPACLANPPLCLGAFAVGSVAGLGLAQVFGGQSLADIDSTDLASATVAGLGGLGNGAVRAAAGFASAGARFYGATFVLGRGTAFFMELEKTNDAWQAAKNASTDVVGIGMDLSMGRLGNKAAVGMANKAYANLATPAARELAAQESKEVANAVLRLPSLQNFIGEAREFVGAGVRGVVDFIANFHQGDAEAMRALFKNLRGVELRDCAIKVGEWAFNARQQLTNHFDQFSAISQVVHAVESGLTKIWVAAGNVLHARAREIALGRPMDLLNASGPGREIPINYAQVVDGLHLLDKELATPLAKESSSWAMALRVTRHELGEGLDQLISHKVSTLYGDLFRLGQDSNERPMQFVKNVMNMKGVADKYAEYLSPQTRAEVANIVTEAEHYAVRFH